MTCPNCKKLINKNDQFCGWCGYELSKNKEEYLPQEKGKSDAISKKSFFDNYRFSKIDLKTAEKHIKNAWIAGVVSLVATIILITLGNSYSIVYWADVILISLLVFGIYKKSIASAVLLFVYYLTSHTIQIIGSITAGTSIGILPIILGLVFLNFYYLGILGTIRYKKLKPASKMKGGFVFGIIIGILVTIFLGYFIIQAVLSEVDYQPEEEYGWNGLDYDKVISNKKADSDLMQNQESWSLDRIEPIIDESIDYSSISFSSLYFMESIARIICFGDYEEYFVGSGSIWWNNNHYWIITNDHVLDGQNECIAVITKDWGEAADNPEKAFRENNILLYNIKLDGYFYLDFPGYDLAYSTLEEIDGINQPLSFLYDVAMTPDVERCNKDYPIGTKIKIFGYPAIGSNTVISLTEGLISSFEKLGDAYYYLTSAKIEGGTSGGLAFVDISEYFSCAIGIPTFVLMGDIESFGRILMINEADIYQLLSTSDP